MKTSSTIFREEVFSPSFPLDGPHLVAASAGTGKTHNIQNVCARLVMERGLRVSQIQVMTYTDAATKELHDRIRTVFANLQRFFAGDTAELNSDEIERLEKLRECARVALGGTLEEADKRAKNAVELALLEFDQAAISTIHGFCRRALVRFAFETGAAFQTELGDDGGAELERRARDWWSVNRPLFPPAELVAAVKGLGGKTGWSIEKDLASGEEDPCLAAAAKIVEKYEEDRPLRENQTFDDLLRSVRGTLGDPLRGPALARSLRAEFKAVVVDEFQDTDPVQYGIFWKAFLEGVPEDERPPVFFVGDPKQAIYAFRGGDIYTYRVAARMCKEAGRTYWLDQNFRSTPRLVEAVNKLFGDETDPDGTTVKRTFGDDAIPYEEDVKPLTEPGRKIDGLTIVTPEGATIEDPHPFRIVCTTSASARDAAVVDIVMETLAEQAGRVIKAKGVEEEFGPKHIAILVTSNEAARSFRTKLCSYGIPAVVSKSGNVFGGETATALRSVLLAMAGIGGRRQIRSALMTPFFAFPVENLEKEDGESFAEMVGFFGYLNRTWAKRGFNAAFAKLEDGCNLRARFAALPDGERRLADLFQIVDLADAAIRERGPSPEALVDWLTERIKRSDDKSEADADAYARELESDADAVQIMTVHKAKGLEFPVTIIPVPSVGKGGSEKVNLPCFHHDEAGNLLAGRDEAQAAADAEAEAEKTRLFYVAFTRATRRTVVITADNHIPALNPLLENARRQGAGEDNSPLSPILWSTYPPTSPDDVEEVGDELLDDIEEIDDETPAASEEAGDETEGDSAATGVNALAEALVPRDYGPFQTKRKGSYSSLAPSSKVGGDDADAGKPNNVNVPSNGEESDFDRDTGGGLSDDEPTDGETTDHPIFDIGGGARTGTCWHDILEKLPFDAEKATIEEATAKSMRLHGLAKGDKEVDNQVRPVAEMIEKTLDWQLVPQSGEPFTLRAVKMSERFSEWEFDFSSKGAVDRTPVIAKILKEEWAGETDKEMFLKAVENWDREIPKGFFVGFLDLLFEHDGRWYVVDWKSNKVGGKKANFSKKGIQAEMAREGYFFQYLLYSAVLHRFLKETMGPAYSWEKHFGGVFYYFLRGIAAGGEAPVFSDRPTERLLDRLCQALGLEDR